MPRLKDEPLSIRNSAEIKQLLRLAAGRERRSVAPMNEILMLEYARRHDLRLDRSNESQSRKAFDMTSQATGSQLHATPTHP